MADIAGALRDATDRAKRHYGLPPHFVEEIEECAVEIVKLHEAAKRVVWFDWSDNDPDAVKAVADLRAALT